jgi:NAD(P)-dependent dehydrogenase (short-subunit alcohol dehydrogenase family)
MTVENMLPAGGRRFSDKVAIVTGAGQGIGFEIGRQLALQGAQVLLNGDGGVAADQCGVGWTSRQKIGWLYRAGG